ncbi:MAG: VOC family protein [Acidimicrobiia bacterium]|nr:VOC family protein [Acidimicrobiia bacterium]
MDLSTPDIEGAQRFYAELLGWELDIQRTPMGEYTVASSGGRQVAGMMAQAPEMAGAPAVWTVFVVVDDMEAILTGVTGAGGAVLQSPFEIPGGARVAVVADGSGAMFALISGGPEPGYPYFSEEVGAVCWAELMSGDVQAATGFYQAVFGWTAETDDTGPVPYTVCNLDGDAVAGMIGRPDDLPADVPDSWSVYFTVADCKDTQSRAVERGGSVILSATPTPMGPFAVLADPAGAAFQIMEMASPPEPS